MTTRMLIDARHREETRVAVVKGHRIEEFDFESAEHKQIKGNIYLAKVTRVEPSLQAAFVEYGGNRHGFLAFSEIHPDYFQIPKEDREALLAEEAELAAAEAALRAESEIESLEGEVEDMSPPPPLGDDDHDDDHGDDHGDADEDADNGDAVDDGEDAAVSGDGEGEADGDGDGRGRGQRNRRARGRGQRDRRGRSDNDEGASIRRALHRRYKIQDVIRRRQVVLVQVVKEERGNKGAALTTYLSLAGRYCVLMPNSSHGGGISRKISNGADRKRLKSVIDELGLPASMGCIVRTAGLERTKTEIKRDFDYLARLWDEIRDRTLKSQAPALIHSDSDLVKRAIRDIYNSGIEEVLVEGDDGYRAAKDFMKLLMPSHARRVKHYAEVVPLFQRYGVEDQLSAMYQPTVPLKSGGYLVINPTEALVSIDINSGRSTREHNIEQTAFNTNLEAAYEIARQLRLRDMAGLIVIDFIDMEVGSHVRKVERAMRDALKNDRARIQVGRISGFGLMEMSRQRLRTGVLEASTRPCPHCEGTGLVRTASSAGLSALRVLEEEAARGRGSRLVLRASQEATIYVLNNKRAELAEIEGRYGVAIEVLPDGQTEGARMSVEASGPPPENLPRLAPIVDDGDDDDDDHIAGYDDDDADDVEERGSRNGRGGRGERDDREEDGERRGRRRRRRRGGRDRDREPREEREDAGDAAQGDAGESAGGDNAAADEAATGDDQRARRRRGRRGGRNRRRDAGEGEAVADTGGEAAPVDADVAAAADAAPVEAEAAPAKPRRGRRKPSADAAVAAEAEVPADVAADAAEAVEEAPAKSKRGRRKPAEAAPVEAEAAPEAAAGNAAEDAPAKPKRGRGKAAAAAAEPAAAEPAAAEPAAVAQAADASPEAAPAPDSAPTERRRGWWQKTFG